MPIKRFGVSALFIPGLHIVYTLDEVDVVQNLMFYIEAAYKVAVSILLQKSIQTVSELIEIQGMRNQVVVTVSVFIKKESRRFLGGAGQG